jgi:transaldolase / glucose-6-phosphate isomerase
MARRPSRTRSWLTSVTDSSSPGRAGRRSSKRGPGHSAVCGRVPRSRDPRYRDTLYVEELIGPNTVDTVPNSTLLAFQEHGRVRPSLESDVELARRQLQQLAELGIDLDQVTRELEIEGVAAFTTSYEALRTVIGDAVRKLRAGSGPRQWHHLGTLQPSVDHALDRLQQADAARRLWAKDPTLWSSDPRQGQQIRDRLGWLSIAEQMAEQVDTLRQVAREGQAFADVVLLGMGGSSLAPEVLRHTFGIARGHPRLHVLDTTDPATVLKVHARLRLEDTLFLVASKSGETVEPLSHFAYFWDVVSKVAPRTPGRQFAAITDPGTPLEQLARQHDFRWLFRAPPDVGGRYSALTSFGLVPGALLGVDVAALLERGVEMMHACDACVRVAQNPGAWLGGVLGQLASTGRDKITLLLSPKTAAFGSWVEQLLAESTGKHGKGLIPIEGEPVGQPSAYGQDRLFVSMRLANEPPHPGVQALETAGQPVVSLTLRDKFDLGGEFLRWEIATAIACSLLGIDPFDQPNVQESKDNTRAVLSRLNATGTLPDVETVDAAHAGPSIAELLRHTREGAYVALMAYTAKTAASERAIARIRAVVRDRLTIATTAGYGPRFLHSTGQLHKGGPPVGLFVQIVQDDAREVAIPGQSYGFSILKQAQALGDLESLRSRGLPILRVSLGRTSEARWKALAAAVEAAITR